MCNTTQVHVKYITSPFVIPVVCLFHTWLFYHSTPLYTHLCTLLHTTSPPYTHYHTPLHIATHTLHPTHPSTPYTPSYTPLHPAHPPTPLYTLHTPPHSRVMPSQRSQRWHSLTWAGNPSSPWSMCPWMEQACDA